MIKPEIVIQNIVKHSSIINEKIGWVFSVVNQTFKYLESI